jgi:hypothetical protein
VAPRWSRRRLLGEIEEIEEIEEAGRKVVVMAERTEHAGGGWAACGTETDGPPAGSWREQVEELREQAREETVRLAADARAQVTAVVHRRQQLLADRLSGIAAALREAGSRLLREAARPAGALAAGAGAWPAPAVAGAAGVSGGPPAAMPPPLAGPAPARVDAATRGLCELAEGAARQVERASRYVRRSELREMVRDLEEMARRRPVVLVGGGFATGMLLARFFKSSSERASWPGPDLTGETTGSIQQEEKAWLQPRIQ